MAQIGPKTRRLALAFARDLRKEITDENVEEVVRRNARPDYAGSCASHDFCDANMVMADAFHHIMGRDFEISSEVDMEIWNRAWDTARASGFTTIADEKITLHMPGEPRHRQITRYRLGDLLAADDGLQAVREDICATLESGLAYLGGGGAAPEFKITLDNA